MFLHAACMLLLCLLFPILASNIVNPILEELFGYADTVLSMSVLTTMAIMLVSVLIVPVIMAFVTKSAKRHLVPIYMNGVNEGDNRYFVNSFGEPEHLYLSNWYLRFDFGRRRLMRPAVYISASVLIVVFCLLIGGAV